MAGPLQLLPAVDVQDGRAVQLVRGDAGSATVFGDPIEAALDWQRQGPEWIHLVDLDAASGRGENRAILAEIVGRLDVRVQISGGIDDDVSLAAALSTGAERANLGTAALNRPTWCARVIAEHGELVTIGLDVRGQMLAARGGSDPVGMVDELVNRLDAEGCARYVVTDVDRDGMLEGPNLELLRRVCAMTERPIVASGGVGRLADLRALQGLVADGVEGAIVGTALHAGRFSLADALVVARAG